MIPRLPLTLAILSLLPLSGAAFLGGSQTRSRAVSSPQFVDATRAAGLSFHLTCGGAQKLYIMESMCGGVAVIDYDNDGWPDIFLVNGSTLEGRSEEHTSELQ